MSTSEALSCIQLVDPIPTPVQNQSPIVQVLIIIGDPMVVFHEQLHIPFGFVGTILFTLAGDVDTQFTGKGVVFADPTAPFVVETPGQRRCAVTVNNVNPSPEFVGVPFVYDLELTTGKKPFVIDPTVENDPPIIP